MQRTGAGNGDLRDERGVGADELEIRHVDRPGPLHAAVDERHRLGGALPGCRLGVLAADRIDREVAELAVEEAVIGAAAELAVGREFQADAFLQRERVPDRLVLRLGSASRSTSPRANLARVSSSTLRPQQAADMLRPERRLGP